MGWTEELQAAIDYLENGLTKGYSVEEAAKRAHVSVFHFQRLFSVLTGMSVGDYVRKRRLTLAGQELAFHNARVLDTALKYGYETPEAFAKAFKRQHGLPPSEVKGAPAGLTVYNRLVISVLLKGADPMKVRMEEKEAFSIVGVKRTFSCENNEQQREIPKMWAEVHQNGMNDELVSLNNGVVKGVLGVCRALDAQAKTIEYWIAAAHDTADTPKHLERLTLAPATYAIFEVHGPMPHAMQDMWNRIYSEWFPSNPYRPAGAAELEVYPLEDAMKEDYYSEIWIPIVPKA
jgi:AraC family transcriptional regulator